jgi:hypothetical protein
MTSACQLFFAGNLWMRIFSLDELPAQNVNTTLLLIAPFTKSCQYQELTGMALT